MVSAKTAPKSNPLRKIGGFFSDIYRGLIHGDWAVRLSLLFPGVGYMARRQWIKGILVTLVQAILIAFIPMVAIPYLSKFGTLGTVKLETVFNMETMKNEFNNYDHSFKILLFGVISIVVLLAGLIAYLSTLRSVGKLYDQSLAGVHINTFKEDVNTYLHEKFHITLLFLPCMGILVLTIVPLIIMILVAFTNYDSGHIPPANLFTWVGLTNFKLLFENSISTTFGYSFRKVLTWTLTWSFFATTTTYFGGILLAMFINNKRTRLKKMWRSLFIVAIAVPQFVSLLLVRNFFADNGIVNTLFNEWGVTAFLQRIGLVSSRLTYVPFLTDPTWCKVMIILINIWIGVPYVMLISTGVLMNIPNDLLEAARIDGANAFQSFRSITMPYVLHVTGPYLISSFVSNINNFNVIFLITQDVFITKNQLLANSNAKETDLLVHWLYRLTQEQYNYKMASVLGIAIFVICSVFTLLAFRQTLKAGKEETFQ